MHNSQIIEAVINYSGEIALLIASIYIFSFVNKISGALIFLYSIYSILILLSSHNVIALAWLHNALISTISEPGKSVPSIGASSIFIMVALSRMSLSAGVVLLVRQIIVSRKAEPTPLCQVGRAERLTGKDKKLYIFAMKTLEIVAMVVCTITFTMFMAVFLPFVLFITPKWNNNFTSGKYESFEIGQEKKEVMETLVNLAPKESIAEIRNSRTEISSPIEFLSPEAKNELLQFNEWYVEGIVGIEHCERPDSTLYFTNNHLSKIEIKCWYGK